jgi:hypothetical protein
VRFSEQQLKRGVILPTFGKEEPDSLVEEMRKVRKKARESSPGNPQYVKKDLPE